MKCRLVIGVISPIPKTEVGFQGPARLFHGHRGKIGRADVVPFGGGLRATFTTMERNV
jgi:hypothetical protein